MKKRFKTTNNLSIIVEREKTTEKKRTVRERSGSKMKSENIEKSWKESKRIF
jgi:hypothetical protein